GGQPGDATHVVGLIAGLGDAPGQDLVNRLGRDSGPTLCLGDRRPQQDAGVDTRKASAAAPDGRAHGAGDEGVTGHRRARRCRRTAEPTIAAMSASPSLGIALPLASREADPADFIAEVLAEGRAADAAGFDLCLIPDHHRGPAASVVAPPALCAALAATTER